MSVQFDTKADLNENVLVATDWKKAICLESYKAVRREFYFSNSSSMECMLKLKFLCSYDNLFCLFFCM